MDDWKDEIRTAAGVIRILAGSIAVTVVMFAYAWGFMFLAVIFGG
jgi:hypothetical protein